MDLFDKNSGFLVGTTNQLFLHYPKARADIILNIDRDQVIYGDKITTVNAQNQQPKEKEREKKFFKLYAAKNHTNNEKLFISNVMSQVSFAEDDDDENEVNWDQNDIIRTEMRKYLNQLLTSLIKMKKCVSEFETRYSPESCIAEHE